MARSCWPNKLPLIVAALALVLAACGTRLPDSAFQGSGPNSDRNGQQALAGATGDQSSQSTNESGTLENSGRGANGVTTAAGVGTGGGVGNGSATGGSGGVNTSSDVGVTPTSIKIGNITSILGFQGPDVLSPSLYGLESYVEALNARGGINGRKIDFHTCDDSDTGDRNLVCAQQLVDEEKIFMFLANNSAASARSAAYVAGKGVPDLGLPLNNGYYKYPTMFSFYGNDGYARDGKHVGSGGKLWQQTGQYRWFKQQRHIDKSAVFFYTIAVSQQAGYAQEADMAAEGIQMVYEGGGSHQGENFAAPTFDTDVVNMKQRGVQGIWDAIDSPGNQKLCAAMDRQSFQVTAKVSTIEAWGQAVSEYSSPCRNSVYSDGTTEPYSDTSNPLVGQFRSEFAKYQPGRTLHEWSLEGWAMGYEFTKAAQSMGPNLTRAGFMKWMDNLNNDTVDGLTWPHDYKPKDYTVPFHDCFSIVRWQDSAATFVNEAPVTTCYDAKWISYTPTDDGS